MKLIRGRKTPLKNAIIISDDMEVKEAITQLEIIATNMVGRLCEIPNEDERQIELLNKQIEALDMGIDALKKIGE